MKLSLKMWFIIWIVGSFIGLIIVSSITWRAVCSRSEPSNQRTQSTREDDNGTHTLRQLIDDSTWRSIARAKGNQKDAAYHSEQTGEPIPNPRLLAVICDAKITDLGLVYLTFCLVIVGWFGIRSAEQNTEAIERSYLFFSYSPPKFRNRRVNFQLAVTNTERCPGIMKEIGYAFLQRKSLPHSRKQADWPWKTIEYDWATPSTIRRDIGMVHGLAGDCFFVCYVNYQDMFTNRKHTSWMGMRIRPDAEEHERITRAGDAWNDWD